MRFVNIVDFVEKNAAVASLKRACEQRGLEYLPINLKEVDYFALPTLKKGDMLYRHGLKKSGFAVEQALMRSDIAHFYGTQLQVVEDKPYSYYYNERAGLPVVKTIPLLPVENTNLDEYVNYLGGFPVIAKVMGGSKGVGVIKIDTIEGLKSTIDYLRSLDETVFLRSYVPHEYYGRFVVVGDEVVATHTTHVMAGEFRTNASGNIEDNKRVGSFSSEVENIAVEAVRSLDLEFGGVVILFDQHGQYFISEVNFPCGFTSTERIAQTDIAGPMVDHLLHKASTM